MPDRREMLLGLMAALGGPAALAACNPAESGDALLQSIRPDGRLAFYRPREFRLVGVIADAIIPRTDTPGALDANVPDYLDGMMAQWASAETKTKHRAALRAIRARLREHGGADILSLPDEQRRAAMEALDAQAYEGEPDETSRSYRELKQLIAQIYYASEVGATQELQYQLVPGGWRGDAPLAEIGRTWAE